MRLREGLLAGKRCECRLVDNFVDDTLFDWCLLSAASFLLLPDLDPGSLPG